MMRSVEEEKGDCANWSRVISVEMKRNEKKKPYIWKWKSQNMVMPWIWELNKE